MSQTQQTTPIDPGQTHNGGPARPSRPRRRHWALVWGAVALVGVGGAVGWFVAGSGGGDRGTSTTEAAAELATAQITRRDIVEQDSVGGTLEYADSRAVTFLQVGSAGRGDGVAEPGAEQGSQSEAAAARAGSDGAAMLLAYSGEPVEDPATEPPLPPTTTSEAPTTTEEPPTTEEEPPATTEEPPATTTGGVEQPGAPGAPGGTDSPPAPGETAPAGAAASTAATAGTGSLTGATTAASSQAGQQGGSARPSLVTWLPGEGTMIGRGQTLFRVNGKSTYLLFGEVPAHRTLRRGVVDGPDVEQLERNLVELGFDPKHELTVDEHFGLATKAAVRRWQKALGANRTGEVKLGTVVFLPGPRRVGSLQVSVGAAVQQGTTVMLTTSTTAVVTVALPTSDRNLVAQADEVEVELPDGGTLTGTISAIGTVASVADATGTGGGGGQASSGEATVELTIAIAAADVLDLDQAPVDVSIARETRSDVLAVPASALLALASGGYGLEVVEDGGTTRLVRVEPGLFADGVVEISGDGIDAGMQVVVPA